jgi:serine/threonine protein phosphatase PrpC
MKIYSYSLQGKRDSNEDNHFTFINNNNSLENYNPINLFCVFDGHGGKLVSTFLKSYLPSFFLQKSEKPFYEKSKHIIKHINNIFDFLQNNLKMKHPRAVEYCGSTACVVMQIKNKLWIANTGDSRCIICNRNGVVKQITEDHKPDLPREKERIEQLGGKIKFDGYEWRIKNLSLSRAFGDLDCQPYVIHNPDIYSYTIHDDDKFLIIGCDGLWEQLTNENIIDFIKDLQFKNFKGNYAKELATYALNSGSNDNISVIIYLFN